MIIDISRPLYSGMPVYPGNPEIFFEKVSLATATSSAVTRLTLGSHSGTHIDAASHIDPQGLGTDHYQLETMNGQAEVIDVTSCQTVIIATDIPATTLSRILFKTRNSTSDPTVFDPHFVALDETAAEQLVERRVQLVGIDGPSIKKRGAKDRVHNILLRAGVVIVEGLWLQKATAGSYELLCLPLPLRNVDGAPIRAVLRK